MGFRLKIISGPEAVGKLFALKEGENLAGRTSPPAAIVLNGQKVSKKHCLFALSGGKLTVKDLGSSNGIYVNGSKVTEQPLRGNDRLLIGDFMLEVVADGA